MTRLVLARHGESVWHAENRYAGSSDIGMSPRGRTQARRLAEWAAAETVTDVWSSDAARARETAAPAAEALGLEVHVDPRLREVDFGRGEGLTRDEMQRRFADDLQAFLAHPATTPLPDGEVGVAAAGRFLAALEDIAAIAPDGRVLIVAHSTVMRIALCLLLGVEPDAYREVFPEVGNAAITEIRYAGGSRGALLRFNADTGRL